MRKTTAIALVFAAGCGGDDVSDMDRLMGAWIAPASSSSCAIAAVFGAQRDDQLELDIICELQGGGFGLEAQLADFTAADGVIRMTSTHSTCPGDRSETETISYEFLGDSLRLSTADGLVVLERLDQSMPGSGGAQFGCFGQDGSFTPYPVTPL